MYTMAYHVTQKFFRKFNIEKCNPNSFFGRGIYLSDDICDCVENYNRSSSDFQGRVSFIADTKGIPYKKVERSMLGKADLLLTCAITIKNPLMALANSRIEITKKVYNTLHEFGCETIDCDQYMPVATFIQKLNSFAYSQYEESGLPYDNSEILQALGYDGVIQQPEAYFPRMYWGYSTIRHYVVFNPHNRIKICSHEKI